LSRQLFNESTSYNSLKINNFVQAHFQNINFFENSRLWLFKKFYFTNNQQQGLVIDYPQNLTASNDLINTPSTFQFYTGLYVNNLLFIKNDSLSPSLIFTPKKHFTQTTPNLFDSSVNLTTSQLDVLVGYNLNFITLLTSNPKQTFTGNATYFNSINFSKNANIDPKFIDYSTIKFS
jgi:hypothetical protein